MNDRIMFMNDKVENQNRKMTIFFLNHHKDMKS